MTTFHTFISCCGRYNFVILFDTCNSKRFQSNYIDNIIGIAALIFGIVSIPRVKEWLGKKVK